MADEPLDFTFKKVDDKDTTWYARRELGHPDDPYNKNCKKVSKDDPQYKEWLKIGADLCDQLEKDILQDEGDGWVFLADTDGVVSHRKENEGSNILTFKGCTVIPSTAEIIRLFLIQMDQRKYWDPTFVEGNFEYEAEVTARLVTNVYSAPWPVSYRDFVCIASEALREDGLFLAGIHSIEHDEFPDRDGFVRGIIYSSGFVIKPIEGTPDGLPQCRVWYTGTVDTAGWIPVAVANVVNSNQPQNLASLRKLVISVADMLMDVIKDLFRLESFTAANIENIFSSALEKHGHDEHPDILYDALKNYFLEKRVGPTDEDLLNQMETQGKKNTMHKIFRSFQHYMLTMKDGKEIYAMAQEFFSK
uniref:START domain-containing protein n=1 Tax=Paramoeba aestuarina TaxID=180227 RepID=A0A7S4U807_9EUKA|eukprot:CAMPEP_0201520510 /NCGR_PEP_ID=MMETSP0161_2-20130828/11636_1 /ASSEMBLY_ACC=CAM_ASM_000251 /TAXON_ID=180227 /ORGANISM="Neoparamoeba aestuarina, Strain SoJaBio B1-5/56/2" /LENGTH=360 /DNA_ID=CAMNT_0047918905 /DNA_START=80 /DNA_END=1162 /DNA_ORIENTATION=+